MSDIIDSKSLAILHISLNWESDFAGHVATFYVPLNVWREPDLLPPSLAQALTGQKAGTTIKASFPPGSLVPAYENSRVNWLPPTSFAHGGLQKKRSDTGGECRDWLQIICDGPGTQDRDSKTATDFFSVNGP